MINAARYKELLLNRQKELRERLERLEDVLDDPKSADFSERAAESELDEVYEAEGLAGQSELIAIEEALKRLKKGTFGICLKCENEISAERLNAVPHAAYCRQCMG